jgi:glutathione synthase/RimK-type ligase-like ATP-grasp enzyme
LFNQRQAHLYQLSLKYEQNIFSGILQINGQEYDITQLKGIYIRLMDSHLLPEVQNKVFNYIGEAAAQKSALIHQQLMAFIEVSACRILNRPWDMLSNLSKPYQSQLIAAAGFAIPPTCITNSPQVVLDFQKKQGQLIFKSISSVRSIVKELDESRMKTLNRIKYLPTQFQKKLTGTNIRVHVVGDVLFATKVESEIVDYRYAGRENATVNLTPFELPPAIEKKCFNVAERLHLPLCGIDLFHTDKGKYYCFEVNPSPGYSYYQQSTGQDIAPAIVKWLYFGSAK